MNFDWFFAGIMGLAILSPLVEAGKAFWHKKYRESLFFGLLSLDMALLSVSCACLLAHTDYQRFLNQFAGIMVLLIAILVIGPGTKHKPPAVS